MLSLGKNNKKPSLGFGLQKTKPGPRTSLRVAGKFSFSEFFNTCILDEISWPFEATVAETKTEEKKPTGFGLNKAKETPEKPDTKGSEEPNISEAPARTLSISLNASEIHTTLEEWFSEQVTTYQERSAFVVFAECFEIVSDENTSVPLLHIPVWVHPGNKSIGFEIKGMHGEYKYHPAALHLANKLNITLPELPRVLEDLNPGNFFEDVKELLIPLSDYELRETMQLYVRKPTRLPFSGEDEDREWKLSNADPAATWLYMLESGYIPPSFDYGQLQLVAHAMAGDSFRAEGEQIRTNLDVPATLASLLAYQEKRIVLVGDSNQQLMAISQRMMKTLSASITLPLFRIGTRRQLTNELSKLIDQPYQQQKTKPVDTQKLRKLFVNLERYTNAWLTPFGSIALSPAEISRQMERMRDYPEIPIAVPEASLIESVDIDQWKASLLQFRNAKGTIGDPEEHPWFHSKLTEASDDVILKADEIIHNLLDLIEQAENDLKDICKFAGADAPTSFTDLLSFSKLISFLLESPPTDALQLKQKWSPLPKEVLKAIDLIKEARLMLKEISMYFHPEIIQEELDDLVPELQKQSLKVTRYFNWTYQKNVERLINYGVNKNVAENQMFWHNLYKVLDIRKHRKRIQAMQNEVAQFFGDDWNELNTNIEYFEKKVGWLREYSKRSQQYAWLRTDKTVNFILGTKGKTEARQETLDKHLAAIQEAFVALRTHLKLEPQDELYHFQRYDLTTLKKMLAERSENLPRLPEWCTFKNLDDSVSEPFVREFLDKIQKRKDIPVAAYPDVFEHLVLSHILRAARADRPALDVLTPDKIEKLLELLSLYLERLEFNTSPMFREFLIHRRQMAANSKEMAAEWEILRHELQKHARRNPVPYTLERIRKLVFTYAPVVMLRRDQWEEFSELTSDADVIIHAGGALPDHIPSHCSFIQVMKAERNEMLPEVTYETSIPRHYPVETEADFIAHHIPESSIQDDKVPWQILDTALSLIENETLETPVVLHSDSDSFEENVWKQLGSYAASRKEVRHLFSDPALVQQHIYVGSTDIPSEYVVADAIKPRTNAAFGFQKKIAAPSLPYVWLRKHVGKEIHVLSNDKDILKAAHDSFVSPGRYEPGTPNTISKILSETIEKPWIVHPGHSPLMAVISHEKSDELKYAVWSEPLESGDSLWHHYTAMRAAGFSPFFVSSLHHYGTLKHRVQELLAIMKQDELTYYREKELQEQETAKAAETTKPDSKEPVETQVYLDDLIASLIQKPISDEPPVFRKAGKQRKAPVVQEHELPDAKPYTLHNGIPMGSREDFLDASEKQIQKLLLDIVATESPIHWRNLMRCFASYWQIQRLSHNVEAILLQNISSLMKDQKIFAKDGCLYDNPDFNFKLRNRTDTIAYHRPNEVPLDECEMAIFTVLEKFYPLPEEKLFHAAARIIGFPRADRVLSEQFSLALYRMARQETVQEGTYGLQLKPSLYSSSVKMPG